MSAYRGLSSALVACTALELALAHIYTELLLPRELLE